MTDKFILITNLHWVTIGDIRTFTHALLLEDMTITDRRLQVRGFGTDSAWPTFDISQKSIEHTLVDTTPEEYITNPGFHQDGKRIYTSGLLTMESGLELKLATSNSRHPLDVQEFKDESILTVWEVLKQKVPHYWDAPNMPTLAWLPATMVRSQTRRAG